MEYKIINYENLFEDSWVRCRILSFLDSSFYDDIRRRKEKYQNPSIEIIAISKNNVIGFLDTEIDTFEKKVCSENENIGNHLSGMIWNLGVHPDFRNKGVARKMLEETKSICKEKDLKRLEAWTRDDKLVNEWYRKNDFVLMDEYIHWYYDSRYDNKEILKEIGVEAKTPIFQMFGFAKKMDDKIKKLNRKYFCRRYDLIL